jgi:hypothetical protein
VRQYTLTALFSLGRRSALDHRTARSTLRQVTRISCPTPLPTDCTTSESVSRASDRPSKEAGAVRRTSSPSWEGVSLGRTGGEVVGSLLSQSAATNDAVIRPGGPT